VRLVWSPLALERVEEAEYIARDRPEAARRWVRSLFEAVRGLEHFPESGRPVPELPHRPELREVIHGAYRVIYRVEPDRVSVLTVRHARRLLDPSEVSEGE
jgi:plasmid stabilization system protein ParE